MPPSMPFPPAAGGDAQRGFTLIELAIAIAVIGMMVSAFSHISIVYMEGKRHDTTETRLEAIDEALVRFAAATRRLPCPANGTLAAGAAARGQENQANCGTQVGGIVPWQTLGLTEGAVQDSWGRYFTYRVDPSLTILAAATNISPMNLSECKPSEPPEEAEKGTCAGGEAPADYLLNRGLRVQDGNSADINDPDGNTAASLPPSGAAYVVISHGRNGAGARTAAGTLVTVSTDAFEAANSNGRGLANTIYRSLRHTGPYDDFIKHPTILEVAIRAGLGPRG